jgi:hypothetical protein
MDKYDMEDLISNAVNQKPSDFADVFNNLLVSKLQDAVGQKKLEIAQTMFNPQPNTEDNTEE